MNPKPRTSIPQTRVAQYAPTPGYYVHTPPSEYGASPSLNRYPRDGAEPLLSTPPETNKLLQLSEWEANRPDDELPASFIRYTVWIESVSPLANRDSFSNPPPKPIIPIAVSVSLSLSLGRCSSTGVNNRLKIESVFSLYGLNGF